MDSEPDFWLHFCNIRWPLCVHHDLFLAARNCLHLLQRFACTLAIRCHYSISLRTKMNHFVSLSNISVCFDYNMQVMWLTSNWCWADVGGRHQPNVEATLGRHCTADINPTSAQHMFPCSFFHPIICQNLLCAEIVPMLEATINSGPVLAWLQTYCTLTWKFYPY